MTVEESGEPAQQTIPGVTEQVTVGVEDNRRVVMYLISIESDDYIAVMDVLESSVTDLTPAEVTAALAAAGRMMDVKTVETRLDKLRHWTAVSTRSDTTRVLRYADLMARNWRYTASPAGRQVQRFYRTVLAGTPVLREIPLTSLNRIVTAAETLARTISGPGGIGPSEVELIGVLFTSHDDLDGALVGAEDALTGLADRFDLDDDHTAELKGLVVDYATRVAAELDTGSARAARALVTLRPHFAALAESAVASSRARNLIERGALVASRGGRIADWDGLLVWFGLETGRANRFSFRLVRSLPGMHANLRRLHSSVGTATSRTRALALARAAANPDLGTQIWQAALGDHPWRKLYGESDEDESVRLPSWRDGPQVPVPELLRSIGRASAGGKGGSSRNDTQAKADVAAARQRRREQHDDALREVLAAANAELSENGARVALAALMAAARVTPIGSRRTAAYEGLACTIIHVDRGLGTLRAPSWRILLPRRVPMFHLVGRPPTEAALAALAALSGLTPTTDGAARVAVEIQRSACARRPDHDPSRCPSGVVW